MSKEFGPRLKNIADEIESLLNFECLLADNRVAENFDTDEFYNKNDALVVQNKTADQIDNTATLTYNELCTSVIIEDVNEQSAKNVSPPEYDLHDSKISKSDNHNKSQSFERNHKTNSIRFNKNCLQQRESTPIDSPKHYRKISTLFSHSGEQTLRYELHKYKNKPIDENYYNSLTEVEECNSIIITRNNKQVKNSHKSLVNSFSVKNLCTPIPEETNTDEYDENSRNSSPRWIKLERTRSDTSASNHNQNIPDIKHKSKLPISIERGRIKSNTNKRPLSVVNYKQLFEQMLIEKKNRVKTEELLNNLYETIENNSKQLADLENSKKLAIELVKTLESKYKKLQNTQELTANQLQQLQDKNNCLLRKLEDETTFREQLLDDVKQKMYNEFKDSATEKIQLIKNAMSKREHLMQEQFKNKLKDSLNENDVLKKQRDDLESKIFEIRKQVEDAEAENKRLTNKLAKMKENDENIYREKMKINNKLSLLEGRVEKLLQREQELQTFTCTLGTQLIDRTKIATQLHSRCEQLEQSLQHYLHADVKKVETIEYELQKCIKLMKNKEQMLLNERDELTKLVHDLREFVKFQKQRTEELLKVNKQQKIVIKTQQEKLLKQDNTIKDICVQVKALQKENILLRERIVNFEALEETLNLLRSNLYEKDAIIKNKEQKIFHLQSDLENCKRNIDNIKDTILVKEKIIEDQVNTIKKLKEEKQHNSILLDNYQKVMKNFEDCEYQIKVEKQRKEILKQQLDFTNEENCKLHYEIKKLQKKIKYYNNHNEYTHEKHNKILNELEKQVAAKQKQWDAQRENLTRERDQAISAAKYATKKLVDTIVDFQNQIDKQKKVQSHLSSLLGEKENYLNAANEQIKTLQKIITENNIKQMKVKTNC